MTAERDITTDWLRLVQAEYLAMPGLHLTNSQVQRLWGLEPDTCEELLEALVAVRAWFAKDDERPLRA